VKLALLLAAALLLSACAGAPKPNASQLRAEAAMQRAAQAYARGELDASRRAYLDALRVYESVADAAGRARVLLSLARLSAATGEPAAALASVEALLAEPGELTPALRSLAHGRGAGLALASGRLDAAQRHLDIARAACAGDCAERTALAVLSARLALLNGQAQAAHAQADALLKPLSAEPPGAEHADLLRLRAEAALALNRPRDAVADAQAALALDQAAGRSEAIVLDLGLLARAYTGAGETDSAARHQVLAERARAARRALLGLDRAD
jgi:hypothetical protein